MQKRKLIGKGTFTKCYQISDTQVEVESICPAKECYAIFSQGNPFAPKIEKKDYLPNGYSLYAMPKYPKVRAPKQQLNAQAYTVYKTLREIWQSHWDYVSYHDFVDDVDISTLPDDIKEDIISLASDVGNGIDCKDMRFEIPPRNISMDNQGNLIMLDCFFSAKLLRSTWKR